MNARTQSILIAGSAIGVLGGIPIISCGCCFWGLGGGMLASWLYLRHQRPVAGGQPDIGNGALMGAAAGAVGAVIAGLLGGIFQMLLGSVFGGASSFDFGQIEGIPPEVAEQLTNVLSSGGAGCIGIVFTIGIGLFGYGLLGTLGGMLGAVFFTPKAPPAAPVAPPAPPVPPV